MKPRKMISIAIMLVLMISTSMTAVWASSSKNTDDDKGTVDGRYTFTGEEDWYGYESYLNEQGSDGSAHISGRTYEVTIPKSGHLKVEINSEDTPLALSVTIEKNDGTFYQGWSEGTSGKKLVINKTTPLLTKGTYKVSFSYYEKSSVWGDDGWPPQKKFFDHKITFKGLTKKEKAEAEEKQRKKEEANKSPLKVKSVWASKHEAGKISFKWTKIENATVDGWMVKYRIRKIGGDNKWSGWDTSSCEKNVMQITISIPTDYVIEFHVKAKNDKQWSTGVITTPAGGKYQAMKVAHLRNASTKKRITVDKKTVELKIKLGATVKVEPDHEYPVKDYKKRPKLYPTHMLYDVADTSIISITKSNGEKYSGGIIDGVATIKATKKGTTTMVCRAPNGRTQKIKVTVY